MKGFYSQIKTKNKNKKKQQQRKIIANNSNNHLSIKQTKNIIKILSTQSQKWVYNMNYLQNYCSKYFPTLEDEVQKFKFTIKSWSITFNADMLTLSHVIFIIFFVFVQ